ncbi:MAG: serine hydrolase domain-containing protein [Pseudomonadota bacterium]
MADHQSILDAAVENQDVPFVVAATASAEEVTWMGASGERAPGQAAGMDTVYRIFSMTKAIGSTAAMILIDRGKLSMDTPVGAIIPSFETLQVLDGFDGDTPRYRAPATPATVRHLATHTSGLAYEFWNTEMPRWFEATGHPSILTGQKAGLMTPLMFDPGTAWDYGTGIDWLGQVVEAVDGRRIDQFCREEIFEPLGMADTACEIEDHMADRLAGVKARGEDGTFGDFDLSPPPSPEVYGMGHALYSTPHDYLRFLRMFLGRGALDGNRVLSEDAVDQMLANQIGDLSIPKMVTVAPPVTADFDPFPDTRTTHSFGFMRVEADVPGMRSAGSQAWAGVLNTHYWFDPAKNIAAVLMTQSLPFVEPPYMTLYADFERAVYADL